MKYSKESIETSHSDKGYSEFVAGLARDPEEIYKELTLHKVELNHAASGLAGEAGEVLDLIKKHVNTGKPLNKEALFKEMGDVEFYMQALRNAVFVSREYIIGLNIHKLTTRYPDGYSNEAAAAQADKHVDVVQPEDL